MKVIFRFLNRFATPEYVKTGRWALTSDFSQIERKLNQANEDHCGCCAKEDANPSSQEDYYISFCS
jgi:hypothetical protein